MQTLFAQQQQQVSCNYFFEFKYLCKSAQQVDVQIMDSLQCITNLQINSQQVATNGTTTTISSDSQKLSFQIIIENLYVCNCVVDLEEQQGIKQCQVTFQVPVETNPAWNFNVNDILQAALAVHSKALLSYALLLHSANQIIPSCWYTPDPYVRDPTRYTLQNATPLHYAALQWPEAIPILVVQKAKVDSICSYTYTEKCITFQMDNVTPLQLAIFHSKHSAVQLLKQFNAYENVTCHVECSASYYTENAEDTGKHYNHKYDNVKLEQLSTLRDSVLANGVDAQASTCSCM